MAQDTAARLRDHALARIEEDPRGALESFQRLLQHDPDDMESWAHAGSLLHRLGRPEAALDAFERVAHLAERMGNPEWVSYARQSIAGIRQDMREAEGRAEDRAAGRAHREPARGTDTRERAARPRPGASATDPSPERREREAEPVPAGAAEPEAPARSQLVSPQFQGGLLSFTAGVGVLTFTVVGALTQLWGFPLIRSALLRATDDLMVSCFLVFVATLLFRTRQPRRRPMRIGLIAVYSLPLVLAGWLLFSSFLTLGAIFGKCGNITEVAPACNIQIEDFLKLSPEERQDLKPL
ncbi:MAG: hypothetical protein R3D33_14575 [Hyphomicrobiaceae bacterium]